MIETAQDLADAVAKINSLADGATYTLKIAGKVSADQQTTGNVLALGGDSYHFKGKKNVIIKDNGAKVSITRTVDGITSNYPLFYVESGAKVTVESGKTGDSYNLNYSNQKAPFARVVEGGELTVNGGAYEHNAVSMTPESAGKNKYAGGYGAVLQNGAQDGDHLHDGPDNVWGGKLVVNGGVYKNNSATRFGGGVIFSSTRGTDESTTIITGGDFEYNSVNVPQSNGGVSLRGGGVIHSRRGSLTISGGTFKNNEEKPNKITDVDFTAGGAAVYVANATITGDTPNGNYPNNDKSKIAHFTLTKRENGTAPEFEENKSGSAGGAIMTAAYVNASFESGVFKNNYAEDMGGAVYTEENTVSDFGYSAVYGNTAAHFGGGLWLCPSGVSVSSKRSNLALFDNTAGGSSQSSLDPNLDVHGTGAAGDDLAIMYPNKDIAKSNSVNITSGWYAGKDAVTWYQDGQSTVKATGFGEMGTNWGIGHLGNPDAFSVVSSVPRYSKGQEAFPTGAYTLEQSEKDIDDWQTKGGIALKAIASGEGVKQAAKDQAHLTFTGNTAGMSGGAIGSNGNLRFTSSGVAAWSKVDANDGKPLAGSSWTLTYVGTVTTPYPYAYESEENDLWDGASDEVAKAKWNKGSAGTWTAIVQDNTGQANYVGYDTDSRPGYFAIENLAEGEFSFIEQTAPAGYEKSDATYQFKVDLSTADSAAAYPNISVKGGKAVKDNAIGNTPMPVNVFFMLTKKLIGKDLTNGAFSFSAYERQADGTYSKDAVATARNGEGDIASLPSDVVFSSIKMTKEGESVYKIVEDPAKAQAKDPAILNDPTVFYAKVITTMSKNPNGESAGLTASVSYYKDAGLTKPAADMPEFTNYATTSFEFTKVDGSSGENNGKPLYGVKFKLYKRTGEALNEDDTTTLVNVTKSKDDLAQDGWAQQGSEVTTDASSNGLVKFEKLPVGTYQLVETAAPAGYQLPTGQWRIVVKEVTDGGKKTLKVEGPVAIKGSDGTPPPAFISPNPGVKGDTLKLPNYKGFTLPVSGSTGIWWSGVAGMAMIAASLAALWWQRRRGGGAA